MDDNDRKKERAALVADRLIELLNELEEGNKVLIIKKCEKYPHYDIFTVHEKDFILVSKN